MKAGTNKRAVFGARCAAILAACALAVVAGAGPGRRPKPAAPRTAASDEAAGRRRTSPSRAAAHRPAPPGTAPASTAGRPPAARPCGPGTLGVAHRSLPCGTAVKFVYGGRQIVTRVIDRGPYAKGFAWDLTNGAREALGFEGSGLIRYAVALQYARH